MLERRLLSKEDCLASKLRGFSFIEEGVVGDVVFVLYSEVVKSRHTSTKQ